MIAIPAFLTVVAGFFAYRIITAAFAEMGREESQSKPGVLAKEGLKAFMAFMVTLFMFELMIVSVMGLVG